MALASPRVKTIVLSYWNGRMRCAARSIRYCRVFICSLTAGSSQSGARLARVDALREGVTVPVEELSSSKAGGAGRLRPPRAAAGFLLPALVLRTQRPITRGRSKSNASTLNGAGIGYWTRYTITLRTLIIFCTWRALTITVRNCSLNIAISLRPAAAAAVTSR